MHMRISLRNVGPRDQRGVALFVALIVMVAMSLAGVALIRSIDTTTSVTGNIAFRQSALLQANWAIEDAIAHVYTGDTKLDPGAMIDTTNNDTATSTWPRSTRPRTRPSRPSRRCRPGFPSVLWNTAARGPRPSPRTT